MKYIAKLIQPDVMDTPISECEVEIPKGCCEEQKHIIAARELMSNFRVVIKPIKNRKRNV